MALGLGAATLGAACNGGQRFPVCKSNADCAARDGGADAGVCFNLKCVECRYDTDCAAGQICSPTNECQKLEDRAPSSADSSPVHWEPTNWNECAERCKDPACLKRCSETFEK